MLKDKLQNGRTNRQYTYSKIYNELKIGSIKKIIAIMQFKIFHLLVTYQNIYRLQTINLPADFLQV
jgi:hypothetical protein